MSISASDASSSRIDALAGVAERDEERRAMELFFALLLREPQHLITLAVRTDAGPRFGNWDHRSFGPGRGSDATSWVFDHHRKAETHVAAHYAGACRAAVVRLDPERALDLAFFQPAPTFVIKHHDEQLEVVWLLVGKARWVSAAANWQSLARRLGGRPAARFQVPGTRWG